MRAKMKYICKKFINHQIKKCLLFRCHHAVVIMQTLNWTNQCPLFMTIRHIFKISEDDHPPNTPISLVTHARDYWWTLDFANAFVSPGVNSRGELVPSHGAVGSGINNTVRNNIVHNNIVRNNIVCNNSIYYMANGVLLETKTLVELIRHYIPGPGAHIFHISPLRVTYEVWKFPAIFIVIQMVFGLCIKLNVGNKRKHLRDILR
jgi:hypothetical protein